jgi:uncharacterized protein with GYD domain
MPTYITLVRWTDQGIRNVKESADRYDDFKKMAEKMGCTPKGIYLVTGRYDLVLVMEGPDDVTASKVSLAVGARGAVRTETLRAFTEDEYRKIIKELP